MLDGASRVKDLFSEAARMEMPALAITDHGVMFGTVPFYQAGLKAGVKPIIGSEMYVATRSRFDKNAKEKDGNHHMTAIASSDEGYRNLVKLSSIAQLEGYYYRPRVDKELLAQYAKGIIATTGCLAGEVGQLLLQDQFQQALDVVGTYQDIFGKENFFVELMDHGIADQRKVFGHLIEIAKRTGAPLVATNDLHYVRKEDSPAHDALLCIQTGSTINEPGRFAFDAQEFYLKTPQQMRELFADHPDACDNTLAIAERCELTLEFGVNRLPAFTPPTGEEVVPYIRRLTYEGAAQRYGEPLSDEVRERIEYELQTITSMGFTEYFLIVADLIGYAKRSGVRVGPGRGSAAGSIVSYCLGIVDMDPLRWGLIFERFLNPGRKEMPDIDMDFDDRRRGDVIRYVADKYGEDHVAQIVTFGTIKGKQGIRDAARVLGLPYAVGDRLARMYPPSILGKDAPLVACFDSKFEWPDGAHKNEAYSQAADMRTAYEQDPDSRRVLDIARGLEGLRRQAGVHAAGVVISDKPLTEYLPVWRNDKVGGIVTQYEMKAVADLGLLKMDFLGLRNLTVIEDTLTNLRRKGITLDIDNVPLDDEATYALLTRGDTIGVFQLENSGMRELVKKLQPDCFDDVMALVALYRPGPLGAKMHLEYANRKHGASPVRYPHPDLEPALKDTYGIMLYQEQVIRIATDIAGFTAAEAEGFRKAIGKKIHDVMQAQKEAFVGGCTARGYEKSLAEELWKLIDHFSGYGFNKSHSCCYGFVAFQTAYLKAHHPVEYLAALLTSVKDNPDRNALYLAECRAMGITVEPPDVNHSDMDFTPTDRGTIVFGLSAVRNVGENVVAKIVAARESKGAFTSFADFCAKVDAIVLNRRVIESLAMAGAFDSLGVARSQLLQRDAEQGVAISDWAASRADAAMSDARAREQGQFSLFGGEEVAALDDAPPPAAPELPKNLVLAAEKAMLGVYVSDHPLLAVEAALRSSTDTRVADVATLQDQQPVTIGGLVTKLQRRFTKKGEPMAVFTLEDLQGAIEVVVFPSSYVNAQSVLIPDGIVCVKGKVDSREGEDRIKVVAHEVFSPNLEGGDQPLALHIPADTCTPALVDKLKGVLEAHPGVTPVHLRLVGGATPKTLRLPNAFCVKRNTGLYAELKALLGPKALD
jgi:DNA polymerase III subunit alpha